MTQKNNNSFYLRPTIRAFRTLATGLVLAVACLISSQPICVGCIYEDQTMSSNKYKPQIDPATLKVPKFTRPTSPINPPPPFKLSPPAPSPDTSQVGTSEACETGEGGAPLDGSNTEFIDAVFRKVPDGAFPAVCSKGGDPNEGGWHAIKARDRDLPADNNNYVNCSSFTLNEDGTFGVRKGQFAAYHFVLLDDLGTKVPLDRLCDFQLSWLVETSPGNFQAGIILAEPMADAEEAERLQQALMAVGLCDKGAGGLNRWARLPVAINGKSKYMVDGVPFRCRLVEWHPDRCYSPQEIITGLSLEMNARSAATTIAVRDFADDEGDDVFTPRALENPVVSALKARGLYKTPLGSGKHDITCPWVHEHTDCIDSGTAYFEPDDDYPAGGFSCMHSHRDRYKIRQLLDHLDIPRVEAMHKPVIRIVQGDLHRIVDAAERELAKRGRHFQSGGLIVSVVTNTSTGDPSIVPTSIPALTRELSVAAIWEKYDGRAKDWVRTDPPHRHIKVLDESSSFRHLLPLAGLARQPYFRESDGVLVAQSGYDKVSRLFGVFDPRQFITPEPTMEAARSALAMLEDLLTEFHFVSATDRAAALSAIFTAVVRPSLPFAPAFHVRAPVFGSGKSYLCDLIGSFAGPAGNAKVSYPKNSEEATKVILSLLLTNRAVIEFDDMDTDWLAHGVINRALTAEHITDRILGVSKTATVSTRTLFLGSGNNVGPVRDLLRRVATINVDPRCATPATLTYTGSPVSMVRQERARYVAAVLTVIQAWRAAGSPKSATESIVTYGGAWSDYCRHPLMWLGHPDPATALLEQVKHDPDRDALGGLLVEWQRAFGARPTTVRRALQVAAGNHDLMDAIREFPVEERGEINHSKLGWILKKNANRIVNGLEFQRTEADGRAAWRVVDAGFERV